MEPTKEMVKGLWDHMSKQFGSTVVNKADSLFMKVAAGALQLFGIANAEDFLNRYSTTIGSTIYVPFVIGDDSHTSLWSQILLCVHEHMHVEQWRTEGIEFAAKYLISKAQRAAYEAEAYRSASELSWWRDKTLASPDEMAAHLKEGYGLGDAEVASAVEILDLSNETIQRGGIVNPPTAVALAWLDKNAGQLKQQ